jgi:hypothetical protein
MDLVEFCVKADNVGQLRRLLQRFTEDYTSACVEDRPRKLDFMCDALEKWHRSMDWSSNLNKVFSHAYCFAGRALLDQQLPTSASRITTLVVIVGRAGLLQELISR